MTILLIVVALLIGVVGALSLSPATAGVGGIAFACLIMILARIAQSHSQELQRQRRSEQPAPATQADAAA